MVAFVPGPTGLRTEVFNGDLPAQTASAFAATALPDGTYVIAYDTATQTLAQRYSTDGLPLGPAHILQAGANTLFKKYELNALSSGNYVFVSEHNDNFGTHTFAFQLFSATGAPIGGAITKSNVAAAEVTPLASGDWLLSWSPQSGGVINCQRYSAAGVAIGSPFTVTTGSSPSTIDNTFEATELANGDLLFQWAHRSSQDGVRQIRVNADGSPDGVVVVLLQDTGMLDNRSVWGVKTVELANGNVAVVWTSFFTRVEFPNHIIDYDHVTQARLFCPSGAALGDTVTLLNDLATDVVAYNGGLLATVGRVGQAFSSSLAPIGQEFTMASEDTDGVIIVQLANGTLVSLEHTRAFLSPGIPHFTLTAEPLKPAVFDSRIDGTNGADALTGGIGADFLRGYGDADTLIGGSGNDGLDGGSGNDTLTGGLGDDTYWIDSPSDTVIEQPGEGTDTVQVAFSYTLTIANVENVTLLGSNNVNATGSTGNNLLIGNSGTNTLLGGLGNDVIIGGRGKDLLTGGGGLDRLDFNFIEDSSVQFLGRDVINTFAHGDKIDVSGIDANANIAGNQAFTFVSAFTGVAGQLQWDLTNVSVTGVKGYLVQGDINGDRNADFSLQIYTAPTQSLPGGPDAWNLASWDFIL